MLIYLSFGSGENTQGEWRWFSRTVLQCNAKRPGAPVLEIDGTAGEHSQYPYAFCLHSSSSLNRRAHATQKASAVFYMMVHVHEVNV